MKGNQGWNPTKRRSGPACVQMSSELIQSKTEKLVYRSTVNNTDMHWTSFSKDARNYPVHRCQNLFFCVWGLKLYNKWEGFSTQPQSVFPDLLSRQWCWIRARCLYPAGSSADSQLLRMFRLCLSCGFTLINITLTLTIISSCHFNFFTVINLT